MIKKIIQPRHARTITPKSRAVIAYENGDLADDSVMNSLEAGKFFPKVEQDLKDEVAPDDYPNGLPPLDGQIVSAGYPLALMLDAPGTHWYKHDVRSGQKLTVEWAYAARHLTRRWNYFITKPGWNPQQKLSRAQFENTPFYKVELLSQPYWSHPEALTPPEPTTHVMPLPAREGYHVLLAVWEVANTKMAFYQAIDLNFEGSSEGEPPAPPQGLHTVSTTATSVVLAWSESGGSSEVVQYNLYRNGKPHLIIDAPVLTYHDTNLEPDTEYQYMVSATDSKGRESLPSNILTVKIPGAGGGDTPPTAPSGLHAMAVTASTVEIMWMPSNSANGLKHYAVHRNGVVIATLPVSQLSYTDSALTANTEYRYFVVAVDVDNLWSLPSNVLHAATTGDNAPAEWQLSTYYNVDDRVRYEGKVYRCINAHTSNIGWTPPVAFTLWQPV